MFSDGLSASRAKWWSCADVVLLGVVDASLDVVKAGEHHQGLSLRVGEVIGV